MVFAFSITLPIMEKRTRRVLAENVLKLRKHRKYTQHELGRRAGIGQTTVSAIEDPGGKSIGIDVIESAAHALGIDTYHLLIPDATVDILQNHLVESIVSSVCATDAEGRTNIARIAENEERYATLKTSSPPATENSASRQQPPPKKRAKG